MRTSTDQDNEERDDLGTTDNYVNVSSMGGETESILKGKTTMLLKSYDTPSRSGAWRKRYSSRRPKRYYANIKKNRRERFNDEREGYLHNIQHNNQQQ